MSRRDKDGDFEHAASCIRHWPKAKRGIDDLGRLGVRSFRKLREALPTLGVRLRRTAIWLMAHTRSPNIQPLLLELLQDRQVARAAAGVLSGWLRHRQSVRTVDVLRRLMLQAEDCVVRLAAVEAVPPYSDGRALDALIEVTTKAGEAADVRTAAIHRIVSMLQSMPSRSQVYRRGVSALHQLRNEQDPAVHQALETALFDNTGGGWGGPRRRELYECAGVVRAPRAVQCGVDSHFYTAAQRMIDSSFYLRGTASAVQEQLAALHKAGIDSLSKLKAELPGMDKGLRDASISLLRHTDKRIAMPLLVKLLWDPNVAWDWRLWLSLSTSSSRRVCNEIVKAMLEADSAMVRQSAIHALPYKFTKDLIEPLLQVATNLNEAPDVRGDAIERIGVLADDPRSCGFNRAAKKIAGLLRDKSVTVRFWSCYALGTMRVKSAIPALQRIVRTDRAYYRGMRISMKEEAGSALVAIRTGGWPLDEEDLFGSARACGL